MLYDLENLFSNNQAITADAASTNTLKLASGPIKEVAFGTPIPLRIQITEDFVGATSLNFKVQTATDEAFTTPVTLAETGDVAAAKLKAGYVAPINFIPKGNLGYMRIYYDATISSGSISAGKVTAGIVAASGGSFHEI